jgi:hypothetical protein
VTLSSANSASTAITFDTTTDISISITATVKASVELNPPLSSKYTVSDNGEGVFIHSKRRT